MSERSKSSKMSKKMASKRKWFRLFQISCEDTQNCLKRPEKKIEKLVCGKVVQIFRDFHLKILKIF